MNNRLKYELIMHVTQLLERDDLDTDAKMAVLNGAKGSILTKWLNEQDGDVVIPDGW